jgi:phenylpropionate dioxygenase-like ring-hydroxylating dioxygenase large terminal subunit
MADDRSLAPDALAAARRLLEEAWTLPAEAYTSTAVYGRERQTIFAREWLCAGRVDQLPEPGDYFTLDLLEEKLVVARDAQGEIRVLSRICRHRAAEIVSGSGHARSFSCPYHAWTYGLDGRLIGAPHMEGARGFDRSECRLPQLRSEIWEGWIFVNFDPDAAPLGPRLASLSKYLARHRMADRVAIETAVFDSPFNWKVLVDNFMEAYHHIAIHRDTLEPLFPALRSHVPDNDGPYSVLVMPGRNTDAKAGARGQGQGEGNVRDLAPLAADEANEDGALVAAVVFPFHLFAPAGDSLTWYQILPERLDRFTLRIYSCFPREAIEDPALASTIEGVQEITRVIHQQDIAACEAVFSGLQTPGFESGRLSPLEKAIWQFNQWWIERMTADRPVG